MLGAVRCYTTNVHVCWCVCACVCMYVCACVCVDNTLGMYIVSAGRPDCMHTSCAGPIITAGQRANV